MGIYIFLCYSGAQFLFHPKILQNPKTKSRKIMRHHFRLNKISKSLRASRHQLTRNNMKRSLKHCQKNVKITEHSKGDMK